MGRSIWKSRKTTCFLISAIILYIFIRKSNYEYKAAVTLPNSKPYVVWQYVSDFSHMKYLNPTIQDFTILSDTWSKGHWHYTVQYSENLSHWPHTHNVATAYITIKGDQKIDIYSIESIHKTCFLGGYYCLDTASIFKFSNNIREDGTDCQEIIQYQCPLFLSGFCRREVEYQRKAIAKNLQTIFKNK